ncbi:hypothetical protein PPK16_gp03 [Bacillus phage 049ML001]|uniref:Uncharacterized protein n=1 Tax=Bacillus phage 049ML001 TaxID=2601660 RepID=A0A5P8PHV8_9CAUD|nr:hypothetical protein PPK16_gp03 [Bacillus phage 049ML001]QFR56306.1 hypothetical protein 049ML001_3 [Bacillus phage 049ML001]
MRPNDWRQKKMTFTLNTKPIDNEAIGYLREALRMAESGELKNFFLVGELTRPDDDGADLYYGHSKMYVEDALDLMKQVTIQMFKEVKEDKQNG